MKKKLFKATVSRFACERIGPHVRAMDEAGVFRKELLHEMFSTRVVGYRDSRRIWGSGRQLLSVGSGDRALADVDPAAAVIVDVQNTIANNVIMRWGTTNRRGVPAKPGDGHLASFALSEAGAGRTLSRLRLARCGGRDSDHRAQNLDHECHRSGPLPLFATVNPGGRVSRHHVLSGGARVPWTSRSGRRGQTRIRASSTCELILDDCRVPAGTSWANRQGYKIAIETLNEGRIGIGAQMAGLAAGALGMRFATPGNGGSSAKRSPNSRACSLSGANGDGSGGRTVAGVQRGAASGRRKAFVTEAAMAKLFASKSRRGASKAVEMLGGVGFTKDYPVEKLYRDAKIGRIYEGTTNMQKLTIAKQILGK